MNAGWAVQAPRLGCYASTPLRAACGVRATLARVGVGAPVPVVCRGQQTPLRTFAQGAFQDVGARVTSRLSALGRQWNEYSGYMEIDKLKSQVAAESERLQKLQEKKSQARTVYVEAVTQRSSAQRQTNDLLSRKSTWNDADLVQYTKLLHSEHANAKAEENAERDYEEAEAAVERGFDGLIRSVMNRYHEEQIWSDRIRSMNTYASIGLGVLNAVIFMLALLLVEPYRRRKLAETLEARFIAGEEAAREQMQATVAAIDERLAFMERALGGGGSSSSSGSSDAVLPHALVPVPEAPRPRLAGWQPAWLQRLLAFFASIRERVRPYLVYVPEVKEPNRVITSAAGIALGATVVWLVQLLLM